MPDALVMDIFLFLITAFAVGFVITCAILILKD